jgi:hypothetical protein
MKESHEGRLSPQEFQDEFRRVYADLYPDDGALMLACEHHFSQYPSMQFPKIDEDPTVRIEYARWWMKERTEEDYMAGPPRKVSSYTFRDIKELIGNEAIDVVYLSPAVMTAANSLLRGGMEDWKVNVSKCACGLKNNDVIMGNFSKVLWQRGHAYLDATIEGFVEPQDEPFASSLSEPTYDRPILVVCDMYDEGVMLGEYIHFLQGKGIGIFAKKEPKNFCFYFIGRMFTDMFRYVLDMLDVR